MGDIRPRSRPMTSYAPPSVEKSPQERLRNVVSRILNFVAGCELYPTPESRLEIPVACINSANDTLSRLAGIGERGEDAIRCELKRKIRGPGAQRFEDGCRSLRQKVGTLIKVVEFFSPRITSGLFDV